MISVKGYEENYEVQGTVGTKRLEWLSRRFVLGRDGISVEPIDTLYYEVRVELSSGLRDVLRAAGCPNFSQVIAWEAFIMWCECRTPPEDGYVSLQGMVTLYWLDMCAPAYMVEIDSVFAARLRCAP
jgi:hypothetical protein